MRQNVNRRKFLKLIGAAAGGLAAAGLARGQAGPDRPNILWITCEDTSPVLSCFGDAYAVTPNLDHLAAEGVRYTRAFSIASVCTPSRSCLITGLYASSLGSQHLRDGIEIPPAVRCFTAYLRQAGYYCSNNVKEDYNFVAPKDSWDESSSKAHWRKRKDGQPFFSVFNITTTHQGQIRLPDAQFAQRTARLSPAERHDPAQAPVPPYYPDTPAVRRDQAHFYDLVTAMDKEAADRLKELQDDGLADSTIVFFFPDHGTGLPRHKRWLYDSGLRVPLIIRFPDKYRRLAPAAPGSALDRMVSFVDFAPTVLSLAGVKAPAYMQGAAFLGDQAGPPRTMIHAIRDRVDECYEFTRAVRDERYKYIRHYMPHRPEMQFSTFSEPTPTRRELRRLAAEGKLAGPAGLLMRPVRPAEELYDTQADPMELNNLAGSPEHGEILQRMREALRAWMIETRDTGLLTEAEMHSRAEGSTIYDMARDDAKFPVERILGAAELVGRGQQCAAKATELLKDSDSAVRYWAAVALTAPDVDAAPAAEALRAVLADFSPSVRFAAAEALCRVGGEKDAASVLAAGLELKDVRARLHAAMVLSALGAKVRPAVPQMKAAIAAGVKGEHAQYTVWALEHALAELGERPEPAPAAGKRPPKPRAAAAAPKGSGK